MKIHQILLKLALIFTPKNQRGAEELAKIHNSWIDEINKSLKDNK